MCSTYRMHIARPKQFPSGFLVAALLAANGLLGYFPTEKAKLGSSTGSKKWVTWRIFCWSSTSVKRSTRLTRSRSFNPSDTGSWTQPGHGATSATCHVWTKCIAAMVFYSMIWAAWPITQRPKLSPYEATGIRRGTLPRSCQECRWRSC